MSLKRKKKLLLLLLIFCCCFVAVGYFVLVQGLLLQGHIKIDDAKWDIRFQDIKTVETLGEAKNYHVPNLSAYNIEFFAQFSNVDDSLTYDVTIKNNGTLNAALTSILIIPSDSKYINYTIEGIDIGDKLKKGESKKVKVRLTYNPKDEVIKELNQNVKILFNWKQVD